MTKEEYEIAKNNFIKEQYIKEVKYWNGEVVDYNLDNFRRVVSSNDKRSNNLVDNNP